VVEGVRRCRHDRCSHAIWVFEHVSRRYSQYSITSLSKEIGTPFIPLGPIAPVMRLAVDFDDEPRLAAVEVDDVGIDRVLLAEADVAGGTAEALPQQHFREAHGAAELASFVNGRPAQIAAAPSTAGLRPAVLLPVPGRI
jgi:hypothetical protein